LNTGWNNETRPSRIEPSVLFIPLPDDRPGRRLGLERDEARRESPMSIPVLNLVGFNQGQYDFLHEERIALG
jgi:hypothetical protein